MFGKVLCDEASRNPDIVASQVPWQMEPDLPDLRSIIRIVFLMFGIAEEHGVTFAAGLAAGGLKPVFAVYSSFLQRGYDQLIHDVALQNLPVVFGVDRAGLVGSDGETHQEYLICHFYPIFPI